MSLLQEVILDRLWSRYEREYGAPPPIGTANLDDAITWLRAALEARSGRGLGGGASMQPEPRAA